MRNLILYLIRYHAFFLFVLLEIIAFYIIIQTGNESQRTVWLSSSNSVTGFFSEKYDNVVSYWQLPEENEDLKKENAILRSQLKSAQFNHQFDTLAVSDSAYQQRYEYIPAEIINASVNLQNNYFTINRGTKHGIRPNMGVMSGNGIVGIVLKTSRNFSTVLSLLHRDIRVSAKVSRSEYFGALVWKSKQPKYLTLEDIPVHGDIIKNDTIITSGFSSIFPEGIMIGTADSIWREPGSNFYTVSVLLKEDFNKIKHVYVINDFFKEELEDLQEETAE